jgi:transcriptional regulator with GAF, ATPase, and Fis domain
MQHVFLFMNMSLHALTDAELHSASMETLARRLVEVACAQTRSTNGAVFLWDPKARGLTLDFHLVDGVIVALPGHGTVLRSRKDGRPNGIALTCFEQASSYVCNDTSVDPNYARYFLDVGSVLAVPIPWQGKPMGVLTVSARRPQAFGAEHVTALEAIAQTAAKYLRRAQLARSTQADTGRPFVIKGLSAAWLEVERRMEQVAGTDAPVLVQGESGTGKDLVSRALHFNSRRASRPFVVVNCAAIPETMLESVLFGHVKGAFTGASFDKVGEFQKAHGGTLFLDELGELPLLLQAKVLRAVEHGEVSPLGSNAAPSRVDVRLICATNRDLLAMARGGQFREDLLYRVSVVSLELPPLRTYKDNLAILSQVFLEQAARQHGRRVTSLSAEAMAVLLHHDFPGNVRELKNALEHAVIMARTEVVQAGDLPQAMLGRAPRPGKRLERAPTLAQLRETWVAANEKAYLSALLAATKGRVESAAKQAGVNRVTFYRLMARHGLKLEKRVSER